MSALPDDRIDYFTAGPEAAAAIERAAEARLAHGRAVRELVADVTGRPFVDCYMAGDVFSGFRVRSGEPVPAGLKHYARDPADLYRPDRRTPEGKALRARVAALPGVPSLARVLVAREHLSMFGDSILVSQDRDGRIRMMGVGAEKLGEAWVVVVPVPAGQERAPVPLDSTPLLRSDYWRMREARADVR